jgi:hypothetical protein
VSPAARPTLDSMATFGGIFRSPGIEGVEESDDNGERGRVVGLDLETGVVRVRVARCEGAEDPPRAEPPAR